MKKTLFIALLVFWAPWVHADEDSKKRIDELLNMRSTEPYKPAWLGWLKLPALKKSQPLIQIGARPPITFSEWKARPEDPVSWLPSLKLVEDKKVYPFTYKKEKQSTPLKKTWRSKGSIRVQKSDTL